MLVSAYKTEQFKEQFKKLRKTDDLFAVIIFKDDSAAFYRCNLKEMQEFYRDRHIPMVKQTFR